MSKIKYASAFVLLACGALSAVAGAVTKNKAVLNVYAQPQVNSHIVARVNTGHDLVSFYRHGCWQKVAPAVAGNWSGWLQIPGCSTIVKHRAQDKQPSLEQTKPKVTVKETPYGKMITTERSGVKDGVHYHLYQTRLLDDKGKVKVQVMPKPQVVEKKLKNGGKEWVMTNHGKRDGVKYSMKETEVNRQLSPMQQQQFMQHMLTQQKVLAAEVAQMRAQMQHLLNG